MTLELEIGSTVASVNGIATELEAAPEIMNNTTMVPVRFVSFERKGAPRYDGFVQGFTLRGTPRTPKSAFGGN
jgi:hypothetical protein